ncbi:MAG: MurR/RpiR family transcriptional regulator [Desulfobaccales bacterium]
MEKSNPRDRGRDLQSGALIRLRGIYPSLKAALQKVASLILSQPEMAIYASVNEVAAAARVSEATVMRFCRILGYKGFQDFKISLARELVVPPPRLPEDGGPTALVRWIFKANLAALEETLEVVEMRQLLQAGELLGKCRRLIIGGFRGSGLAAQYAAVRFPPWGWSSAALPRPIRWPSARPSWGGKAPCWPSPTRVVPMESWPRPGWLKTAGPRSWPSPATLWLPCPG